MDEFINPLSDRTMNEFINPLSDRTMNEFINPLSDRTMNEFINPLSDRTMNGFRVSLFSFRIMVPGHHPLPPWASRITDLKWVNPHPRAALPPARAVPCLTKMTATQYVNNIIKVTTK